jgi:hypothetical protein
MKVKSLRQPLFAGMFVCLATSLSLVAQTTTTSSAYEPELNSIVMEASVNLSQLQTPASYAPSLAPLAAIIGTGAVELRSRIDNYDPGTRTFRTTLFLAPPAAPKPTDPANLPALTDVTMVSQSTLRAETIYQMPGTPLAIGMAGRFVAFLGGPLAVAPGTPFLASFAYPNDAVGTTGDLNATFGELSFLIPGALNLYSQTPVGWVIVTPAPAAQPPAANSVTRGRKN